MSAVAQTRPSDEFSGDHHVYEPHKVGLPPLGPYFRALWARRQFLYELARTNLRAQHFNTTLGPAVADPQPADAGRRLLHPGLHHPRRRTWVDVPRPPDAQPLRLPAREHVGLARGPLGRRRREADPQHRLPAAPPAARVGARVASCASCRRSPSTRSCTWPSACPIKPSLLWAIPIIALITVFGAGAAMFTATSQVYFRDLTNFLPYFMRIWLYTSPILFYAEDVPQKLRPILYCNPMYPMLGLAERRRHRGKNAAGRAPGSEPRLGRGHRHGRSPLLHLQGA